MLLSPSGSASVLMFGGFWYCTEARIFFWKAVVPNTFDTNGEMSSPYQSCTSEHWVSTGTTGGTTSQRKGYVERTEEGPHQ